MITIDDVKKVEIRAGKILEVALIEGSDKLLKLTVDFGEEAPRTVLSGIAKYFPEGEGLAGITCGFVANLEPRPMMGLLSQGMILAVSGEGYFSLLKLDDNVPPGSLVK